LFDSI